MEWDGNSVGFAEDDEDEDEEGSLTLPDEDENVSSLGPHP